MSRSVFDIEVLHNHRQDIHQLTLVLVHSLHHHIVHGINRNMESSVFLDPLLQFQLVLFFDIGELGDEALIISPRSQISQSSHVGQPFISLAQFITE